MKKLFPLFLIISLSISITFCKREKQNQTYEPVDKTLPEQQMEDAFIVETQKGDTLRTIKAKHLDNFPKKKLVIAYTVEVTEYDKDKKVKSILTCDKAQIDQNKDVYTCIGNVVVTTQNGVLKTPYLYWDKKKDKILAKNGVILERKDNIVKGKTLITDSKLEKIRLTKVSAKGKLEEKDINW